MVKRICLPLLVAGALVGLMASPAMAKTKTRTFGGPVFQPIPSNGVAVTGFTIGRKKDGKVKDVDARVRISHRNDNHLDLYVVSPKGRAVELSDQRPNQGNGYGSGFNCDSPLAFDDFAPVGLPGSVPNQALVVGTFRPHSPLSALNGASSKGRWSLIVADHEPGINGSINCFQLKIRQAE